MGRDSRPIKHDDSNKRRDEKSDNYQAAAGLGLGGMENFKTGWFDLNSRLQVGSGSKSSSLLDESAY